MAHRRTLFPRAVLIGFLALIHVAPASSPAAETAAEIQRQVAVVGETVCPGEPAVLRLTWRNKSSNAVEFRDDQPLRVTVQRSGDNAAPRQLWLVRRPLKAGEVTLKLAAGKACSRKVLMVVGRPENNDRSPVEFVLPAAGKYSVSIEGVAEPASLSITVRDPVSADGLAARSAWTVDVARCLFADRRTSAGLAALESVHTERPGSCYAPYAMWAHADDLGRQNEIRSGSRAAVLMEMLLDRYGDFPLREEAFATLVDLYESIGDKEAARETAEEFAQAMPASESVAALKQRHGETFESLGPRRPAASAGEAVVRTTLSLSDAEAIPAPVRSVFEAYWKSVSEGNLQALPAMLTRDFMGDYGRRTEFVSALAQHRKGAAGGAIEVTVKRAGMAPSFNRPRSLPRGDARAWRGNLCVIEGSISIKWNIPNVTRGDTLQAPWACWVFYGYPDGTWKLLSETASSRNYLAGAQGQVLLRSLPRTFPSWRTSDGKRERSPYEEIRARLGLDDKVVDNRTQWLSMQVRMTGAGRDEVLVIGQVRMLKKPSDAEPAKETWVEQIVGISLVLTDAGGLVLKDWSLFDATGAPVPGRSGP